MNLGFEILAVKRGYIIDSAYLNIQEDTTLEIIDCCTYLLKRLKYTDLT